MEGKTHKFEVAGLGKAPFKLEKAKEVEMESKIRCINGK